ncbi:hypothetical protein FK535_14150 [Mycolicibacterium sp. 018/SC-01/001]|uniref:hypothetical protein n=1 Tax=Mycolicibacterium sp. 018/SC-01/001 TaxID=2592069 RepID=UPI00117FBA1E|nr:hypothetical protein [Mycolicibacterium sp. 018/SC-01/001]TRW82025.1 hypothetical protein FK535_14150 [Mycolicibacterium sp. 018/SC-01/001]
MNARMPMRARIGEWARRYLPCEIAGTAAEFGAAALAYDATGSLAAAAVAATVGASAGYYAAAFLTALRWTFRAQHHRARGARAVVATLLALRSVAIEFGPAELIDSIAVRPLAFYLGPFLFGNVAAGWIFGKVVSDVAFYGCAILSYERFTALLAHRRPIAKGSGHELAPTVSTA